LKGVPLRDDRASELKSAGKSKRKLSRKLLLPLQIPSGFDFIRPGRTVQSGYSI
jgi:hypothetical protein